MAADICRVGTSLRLFLDTGTPQGSTKSWAVPVCALCCHALFVLSHCQRNVVETSLDALYLEGAEECQQWKLIIVIDSQPNCLNQSKKSLVVHSNHSTLPHQIHECIWWWHFAIQCNFSDFLFLLLLQYHVMLLLIDGCWWELVFFCGSVDGLHIVSDLSLALAESTY